MRKNHFLFLKLLVTLCITVFYTGCLSTNLTDEEKTLALEAGSPLIVTSIRPGSPNSAGGVNLYLNYEYISDKDAKYIYFTVTPYNAVNDMVSSEIGNKTKARCKITGPIKKGKSDPLSYFECVWYNSTITSVKLDMIEIEFMDGTKTSIDDSEIIETYIIKNQ